MPKAAYVCKRCGPLDVGSLMVEKDQRLCGNCGEPIERIDSGRSAFGFSPTRP